MAYTISTMTETGVEVSVSTVGQSGVGHNLHGDCPLPTPKQYHDIFVLAIAETCPGGDCPRARKYAFGLAQDFFAEEISQEETLARAKRLFGKLCDIGVCSVEIDE